MHDSYCSTHASCHARGHHWLVVTPRRPRHWPYRLVLSGLRSPDQSKKYLNGRLVTLDRANRGKPLDPLLRTAWVFTRNLTAGIDLFQRDQEVLEAEGESQDRSSTDDSATTTELGAKDEALEAETRKRYLGRPRDLAAAPAARP